MRNWRTLLGLTALLLNFSKVRAGDECEINISGSICTAIGTCTGSSYYRVENERGYNLVKLNESKECSIENTTGGKNGLFFIFDDDAASNKNLALSTKDNKGYLYYCNMKSDSLLCLKYYLPSPGYYINSAKDETYIECNGKSSKCKVVTIDSATDCGESVEGKFIKDNSGNVGVCAEYQNHSNALDLKYKLIEFDETQVDDRYLVNYNKDSIFNFDYDKKYTYYAVKVSADSIVLDSEYGNDDGVIDQCVLYTDGKVVNRFVDFCSDSSSGNYYTCKYGKCESRFYTDYDTVKQNNYSGDRTFSVCTGETCTVSEDTNGYYLNDNNVLYEFDSTKGKVGTKVSVPEDGYYWNDYQYDYVIKCYNGQCNLYTPKITKSCEEEDAGKIINFGYILSFCPDSSYDPIILNDLTSEEISKGNAGSPFDNTNDYYYLKGESYSLQIDTESKQETFVDINQVTYDCENGKCNNGLKNLPVCESNDCKIQDKNNEEKVNIEENSFCINSNGKIYKKVNSNCSLTYGNNSSGEGIHIFDISGKFANELNIDSVDEWSSTKLVMYYCDSSNCTQFYGYVRHIDSIYKTDKSSSLKMETGAGISCSSSMNNYIFNDFVSGGSTATFQPCIEVTRGASVVYKFANIIVNKNEIGLFLYQDETENKLLKINNNIITYETSITEGYYINSGSIYSSGEVAVGNDALIYCTDSDIKNCVTLPAIPGYYLNAGSDKTKKPVIQCNGTECKSVSIEATECGSGKQVAGGLILNSTTVKVCLDNGSSVEISKRADVGYKSITLASAKDFPQSSTTATNISVKLGKNGSVTILEKEGLPECPDASTGNNPCFKGAIIGQYCINNNNNNNNEIYETVANGCVKFDSKIIFFNSLYEKVVTVDALKSPSKVFGYKCSSDCNLISGYVVVDGENIIQCSGWKGEGCTVTSKNNGNSCSSSEVGKITADASKICFGTSNSVSLPEIVEVEDTEDEEIEIVAFVPTEINSIYGINKNEVSILTVTANSVIVSTLIEDGYYLNKLVSSSKSKALIYCISGTCEVRDALNGYYVIDDELIECKNNGCSTVKTELPNSCKGMKAGSVIKVENVEDEENGYKICIEGENYESINDNYDDDEEFVEDDEEFEEYIYRSINVEVNGFPGISTKTVITVRFGSDNAALVMEDATLPLCDTVDTAKSCTTSNTIVPACITSAKKIYLTANGSCNMVSSTEESKYIYFDGNNKVVSSPFTANSGEIAFAYKCTFTTSDNVSYALDTCKISKGYTISDGKYIQCSGWKYDACIKGDLPELTNCEGSVEEVEVDDEDTDVVLGSSNLLCASGNKISIPYSPNVDTASLILERPSSNFGSPAGVVFLSLSENEIVVTSAPTVAGYYINQNYSGGDNQLIKCSSGSSFTCNEFDALNVDNEGNVEEASDPNTLGFVYPSALDTTGKKIIKCESGKLCESIDGSTTVGQVYIDANAANSSGASKSLIVCTTDDGCKSIVKTTGTYINAIDNSKLIECVTNKCETIDVPYDASSDIFSIEDGLDKTNTITCSNSNKKCISGKIIGTNCKTPIDSTKLCTYDSGLDLPANYYCMTSDKKIYLSSSTNGSNSCKQINEVILIEKVNGMYKKVSPGAVTNGIIYKCSAVGVCTQVVDTNYLFVDQGKNDKGETIQYLYSCAESGDCVLKSECEVGSYLSDIQNKLIECEDSNINNCKVKTISLDYNDKYFVDLAKNGNVIKCTTTECISVKGSTQQGHAYKDGFTNDKVIICDSESCHSTQASNNGYYIDASSDGYKNIFKCPTNCEAPSSVIGENLDATNGNYIIRCTSTTCISKPECRVNVGNSECKDKTYYRVKDKNDYILETNSEEEAYLYYCLKNGSSGAMECSEVQGKGYFINTGSSEIIACEDSGKCKPVEVGDQCMTGTIYKNTNNNWAICLGSDKSAELTSTPENYIIPNQSSNPFGTITDNNSIIKVSENSITLVEDYDFQKDYYVYVESSTNKVLVSGSIPENIQNEPSLADEYKCEGGNTNNCQKIPETTSNVNTK